MMGKTLFVAAAAAEAKVADMQPGPVEYVKADISTAASDVLAERRRQIVRGWTPQHDDEHDQGEIALAALCYADPDPYRSPVPKGGEERDYPHRRWPWHRDWWKPKSRRRDLVKAGALIIAEIERLDRRDGRP